MVDRALVVEVHDDLRKLRDEAITQKETPRLIRLITAVLRLTDVDGSFTATEEEPAADAPSVVHIAEQKPQLTVMESPNVPTIVAPKSGPCEHAHVTVYGRCQDCGECQHTNVRGGVCLTCDTPVQPSES